MADGSDVKADLPFLFLVTAKGRPYTYYRRDGKRLKIDGPFLVAGGRFVPSPEWLASYQQIHASFETPAPAAESGPGKPAPGTLAALVAEFKASAEFREKGARTRESYTRYYDFLATKYGKLRVADLPREFVIELRDKHADTPRKANYLVTLLKRILSFAMDRPSKYGLTVNPAAKVKALRTGAGHRPWEEHEIEAFRSCWKIGTAERAAFELLLGTGQRAEDVAAMTRQQRLADGWVKVRQMKTNELVEIPEMAEATKAVEPYLVHVETLVADAECKAIAKGKTPPARPMVIFVTPKTLRPMTDDYFKHMMIDAYREAGLAGVTTHGLRYTAGTRLKEAGCEWELIGSILGHRTVQMIRKYSEKRRNARLAVTRLTNALRAQKKRERNARETGKCKTE